MLNFLGYCLESILEAVGYTTFDSIGGYMITYPGAFIRWIFLHKKKTFKEIYHDKGWNFNALLSILFYSLLIVIMGIYYS